MDTSTVNYSTSTQVNKSLPNVTQNLTAIWGVMSRLVTDEGAQADSAESLHLSLHEAFRQLVVETVGHILDKQEISLSDCDESCDDPSHFKGDFFQDARDPYTYHDMDEGLDFDGSIRNVPHICKFKHTARGFKDDLTHTKVNLTKLKEYAEAKSLSFKDLPVHFQTIVIDEEHLKMLSSSD